MNYDGNRRNLGRQDLLMGMIPMVAIRRRYECKLNGVVIKELNLGKIMADL